MEALITLITNLGWLAVIAVIYAESGLLIGFFLPGDSLLFTAGFLIQQDIFSINIHMFVLMLWIAACLGDSTGYAFGKKVGRRLFERRESRFFKKDHLIKAELFYAKHGGKTIVLARFIPIIRTFAPIIAGVSNMDYRTFLVYNLIGGAAWTAVFTYLGYYAGSVLERWGVNVEVAAIIIVILSISPMLYHFFKDKDNRSKIIKGTKRQLHTVFRR